LTVAERCGFVLAAGIACCALVPSVRMGLTTRFMLPALIGLTCLEIGLWVLVYYPAFLLENTNSKVLTLTSSASVAGFVGTALAAVALVPVLGAVGGLAAIMLGFTVKAVAIRRLSRRHHHELDADPVRAEGTTHVRTGHQQTS
jgi:hypothetical protein